MSAEITLPTCAAYSDRQERHARQWRMLEGLAFFGGGPLAISASDALDVHHLHVHGFVQTERMRGGPMLVRLTQRGRDLLTCREAERVEMLRDLDRATRPSSPTPGGAA